MKLILLLPILLYAALMFVNLNLLNNFQVVNLFWAQSLELPVLMFSSYFVVLYAIVVYFAYSWVNSLQTRKIKKLKTKITELKSELYNNQKDILRTMSEDIRTQISEFKTDNDKKLETLIRFNEYTLEKVIDETSGNFAKYRKETQKLLSKSKGDKGVLEKMKVWK